MQSTGITCITIADSWCKRVGPNTAEARPNFGKKHGMMELL